MATRNCRVTVCNNVDPTAFAIEESDKECLVASGVEPPIVISDVDQTAFASQYTPTYRGETTERVSTPGVILLAGLADGQIKIDPRQGNS